MFSLRRLFNPFRKRVAGRPAAIEVEAERRAEQWLREVEAREHDEYFRNYLTNHRSRLRTSLAMTPRSKRDGALLELACWGQLLRTFREELGYSRVVGVGYRTGPEVVCKRTETGFEYVELDADSDPYPFEDGSFDIVVCWELIEHLALDPMFMLSEVNRVLKPDGQVFITTPNLASARSIHCALWGGQPMLYPAYNRRRLLDKHHIEYAPPDLRRLVEAAGFDPVVFDTKDFYPLKDSRVMEMLARDGYPTTMRGDTMVMIARKVGPVRDRYPAPIYE